MARGGRGGSRSPPPRSSFAATRPAPAPQSNPIQQQSAPKQGIFSGFGSTLMQGMAFGAGSEVAHQAVRSVIGGGSHQAVQEQPQQQPQQYQSQQQQQPCQAEIQNFGACLQRNDDLSYCQTFSDMLKNCKQQYGLQ